MTKAASVVPITPEPRNVSPQQLISALAEKGFEDFGDDQPTSIAIIVWSQTNDNMIGNIQVLQAGVGPASQRVYVLERAKFDLLYGQLMTEMLQDD